jgi:hypothetical protein
MTSVERELGVAPPNFEDAVVARFAEAHGLRVESAVASTADT